MQTRPDPLARTEHSAGPQLQRIKAGPASADARSTHLVPLVLRACCRDFIGQHSIAEQAKDDHDQETCAICTIIESAALKTRPEKRSWCSRIAQPGQSTNLLGQRRTALVFALDQFNLPGKRYSFAHAKTARRPSCCGCVAWEVRTPPATLLAKGWEKCRVQSETKTAVLKSSLMTTRARARSQQHKWPQLTHGLRHGLPASCRSSEKLESGLRLIKPVRASGDTEASCSAIRAVRPKRSA